MKILNWLRPIVPAFGDKKVSIHMDRKVFLYWTGPLYKLVGTCIRLIQLHANQSSSFNLILLNESNISEYITIPSFFNKLDPAHQSDYARIRLLYEYGGIWLDADTLLLEDLKQLFETLGTNDCFFIRNSKGIMCNAVLGARKNSPFIKNWMIQIDAILNEKKEDIDWIEIGNSLLTKLISEGSDEKIKIFDGGNTMYPVYWEDCISEYIVEPYEHFQQIEKEFQPLLILTNSLYKHIEKYDDIYNSSWPLTYFIQKSFNSLHLCDYDFIEIGTSSFNTLAEQMKESDKGLSVEPLLEYLDKIPESNTTKVNCAITSNKISDSIEIHFIPESVIIKHNLPLWLRGCNSIGKPHLLHEKHGLQKFVSKKKVPLMNIDDFLLGNNVHRVKFLKIDTEGHDLIILKGLFEWLKYLPITFYPLKIQFESNEHYTEVEITNLIAESKLFKYEVESTGHDTILCLKQ